MHLKSPSSADRGGTGSKGGEGLVPLIAVVPVVLVVVVVVQVHLFVFPSFFRLVNTQSLQSRMSSLRSENRSLKIILTERLGEKATKIVHDCTSELSREVMAGSEQTADEDDEIGLGEDPDSELPIGGANAGGGRGPSGGRSSSQSANRPTQELTKPDFRLMQSLQLVSDWARGRFTICMGGFFREPYFFILW